MLHYSEQYQIIASIHYAYSKEITQRILCVSHGQDKINKMKIFLKHKKYENVTKQNFILICLYTGLYNNVTSLHLFMEILSNYSEKELKEIYTWKNKIINMKLHLQRDIDYINNTLGEVKYEYIVQEFKKKHIMFYTMWYIGVYNKEDMNKLIESRRYGKLMKKVRTLLSYITFREESLSYIEKAVTIDN